MAAGIGFTELSMDSRIAVGFGEAKLTRDGETVWHEKPNMNWNECMSVARAEKLAVTDPDHDWRIVFYGALSGETYQRQAVRRWVMIEKNEGFA